MSSPKDVSQIKSLILIAGTSSLNIDNGGYSTRDEFLRSQEYQPSSESVEIEDTSVSTLSLPIPVASQPSTALKLGGPYSLDSYTVCREQNNGFQLFCIPKKQADKVWNTP